mmetsp:Transcript_10102/g.27672  ORF Transcript_10102/g.27672 Transcript_10102/m.27672 type:complete len:242 (+) Transcript_10102:2318-3043(+)
MNIRGLVEYGTVVYPYSYFALYSFFIRFFEKSLVESLWIFSNTALKSSSATLRSMSSRAARNNSSAFSMTLYSAPARLAMSHANAISLCACFSGKLGAWSLTIILGPFNPYTGLWIAPCPMTSIILVGSNPTDSDRASPSPTAATMVPINELMTSFARVPYPTSVEKKWLALPMALRPESTISSNSSLDPAQRKMSVPVAAGTLDPDTGASKNRLRVSRQKFIHRQFQPSPRATRMVSLVA